MFERRMATWGLLLIGAWPSAAAAGEQGSPPPAAPPVSTTIPLPDGSVFYVRYGEPGAVRIRSHTVISDSTTAMDSVATDSAAVARFGVEEAAPAPKPREATTVVSTRERGSGSDLAEIRRIVREELRALRPQSRSTWPRSEQGDIAPDRVRGSNSPQTSAVAAPTPVTAEIVREQILETGLFRTNLILFETSRSELLPRSQEVLQTVGKVLADFPDLRVRVEGHADRRGDPQFNQQLSEARAAAVRQFLLDCCSLDPARVESRGFGSARPIADGDTPTAYALNRRVEFRVLDSDVTRVSSPEKERP